MNPVDCFVMVFSGMFIFLLLIAFVILSMAWAWWLIKKFIRIE